MDALIEHFKIRDTDAANGGDDAALIPVATIASATSTVPQVAATSPFSHSRPEPRDDRNNDDARLEYATAIDNESTIMGTVSAAATVSCVSLFLHSPI